MEEYTEKVVFAFNPECGVHPNIKSARNEEIRS